MGAADIQEWAQDIWREPWQPVSTAAFIAWTAFYGLFLIYAATTRSQYLFIDNANLVVHEGGHLLFGWFGHMVGIWGGTILQWSVPLLLAAYFFTRRQATGTALCLFLFFENWLYTSVYMADARTELLPLVTVGDPENAEHDWNTIFSSLGVLNYDTRIAGIVRPIGWIGMVASAGWLIYRWLRTGAPWARAAGAC